MKAAAMTAGCSSSTSSAATSKPNSSSSVPRRIAAPVPKVEDTRGTGLRRFPVSGVWLRCDDPEVSSRHDAKVYGQASVGSPLMSVALKKDPTHGGLLQFGTELVGATDGSVLATSCSPWITPAQAISGV